MVEIHRSLFSPYIKKHTVKIFEEILFDMINMIQKNCMVAMEIDIVNHSQKLNYIFSEWLRKNPS